MLAYLMIKYGFIITNLDKYANINEEMTQCNYCIYGKLIYLLHVCVFDLQMLLRSTKLNEADLSHRDLKTKCYKYSLNSVYKNIPFQILFLFEIAYK